METNCYICLVENKTGNSEVALFGIYKQKFMSTTYKMQLWAVNSVIADIFA